MSNFLARYFCCVLVIIGLNVNAQTAYESFSPTYEKMRLQIPKDTILTRTIGSDSNRIHLYLGQFYTIDDNIFLSDNESGDNIHTSIFGGVVRLESADFWQMSFNGEFRDLRFERHGEEDLQEFELAPQLTLKLNEALNVALSGSLRDTASPLDDAGVQIGDERINVRTNSGSVAINHTLSERAGHQLKWTITDKDYASPTYSRLEYIENKGTWSPYYQLSKKTRLGLTATYIDVDYKDLAHNESSAWEGGLNVTYTPSPKWKLYLAGSYQDRTVDDSGTNIDMSEFGGLLYRATLNYYVTEKWDISAGSSRTIAESSSSNYYTLIRHDLGTNWKPTSAVNFALSGFTESTEESRTRDNNRYGGTASLRWTVCEYTALSASYQYTHKNSTSDYRSNITSVGLWFTF